MTKPRLAIIGAGPMARYHIQAAVEIGFEISAICGRSNSSNAKRVSEEFNIPECFAEVGELLESSNWEAAVIAVDVPATSSITAQVAKSGRKALVEKPVSTNLEEIRSLLVFSDQVRVAYNRRFYPSTNAAKSFIRDSKPSSMLVQIPESLSYETQDPFLPVRQNSVHVLDLIRFLVGDVSAEGSWVSTDGSQARSSMMMLTTEIGMRCIVYCVWGSPSNFMVSLEGSGARFELKPLEVGTRYEGMTVVEPTDLFPLRTYSPRQVEVVGLDPRLMDFKPGIVEQMREFQEFVIGNSSPTSLATLDDALVAQTLARQLIGELPI